jgi:beta-lactamase regulating signal transducer with metallopeptidase domain
MSLASFFLVYTLLGAALNFAAPRAISFAASLRAQRASLFLFAYRLAPLALASVALFAFCIPSYLWLEPPASSEEVGLPCLLLGALGLLICMRPLVRVGRALGDSARFDKLCEARGHRAKFRGESGPVWVVPQMSPLLAVSGIFRQRTFVSADLLRTLSHAELAVALRHEHAHRRWRDNLKRLLLLAVPAVWPVSRGFAQVDRAWAKFTEWAADDLAVSGDTSRAISLASALVHVARLSSAASSPVFLSSLVEGSDLEERVDRLLHTESRAEQRASRSRGALLAASCAIGALVAAYFLWPATLLTAHELLERLIG